MMNGFKDHGWGMGWGWIIALILVVVLFIFIAIMLNQGNPLKRNNKTPLDILKERYAKGEIDKKEYEEQKKHL
jgi:putative membrane protein